MRRVCTLVAGLLISAAWLPAAAGPTDSAGPVAWLALRADGGEKDRGFTVSREQAARIAAGQYGGRVLAVSLEHGSDHPVWRVKLLKDGRVRIVRIRADR